MILPTKKLLSKPPSSRSSCLRGELWTRIASDCVRYRRLGAHVAVYHRDSGHTVLLDDTAFLGWECLDAITPRSTTEIQQAFAVRTEQPVDAVLCQYLDQLLTLLESTGLVEILGDDD